MGDMFVTMLREMLIKGDDGWAVIVVGGYGDLGARCSSNGRDVLHVVLFGWSWVVVLEDSDVNATGAGRV